MTKTLEVSDETYERIKEQLKEEEKVDLKSYGDLIGRKVYLRTVTYHLVGEVTEIAFGKFVQLKNASWVADSGRFMQAIKDGTLNEVEPVGIAFVNLDTVTDFYIVKWELPTEQK